ncbi:MAG: hypothetical protein HYV61_09275 [Candidatus Rokubacteria bacterium]|nr:hypothetical protein [Candidatus Rokubacteria bacterium]
MDTAEIGRLARWAGQVASQVHPTIHAAALPAGEGRRVAVELALGGRTRRVEIPYGSWVDYQDDPEWRGEWERVIIRAAKLLVLETGPEPR